MAWCAFMRWILRLLLLSALVTGRAQNIDRAELFRSPTLFDAVKAKAQGGQVIVGGNATKPNGLEGFFVEPTIVRVPKSNQLPIAVEETFAPILYVFTFRDLDQAIAMNNDVPQGLSSAIFTDSVRESGAQDEKWWLELMDYVDKNYRTMGDGTTPWAE